MTEQLDLLSGKERAEFWENHIQAWQETGLSQSEYCRRNELIRHRFWYWRKRTEEADKKEISFVPVPLPAKPMGPAPQVVRVVTPNGYRVELAGSFDPILVGQLMHSIRDL